LKQRPSVGLKKPPTGKWPSPDAGAAAEFARANTPSFVATLQRFVQIPSVSSDPKRAGEVAAAADFLAHQLRQAGLNRTRIFKTARHPIVYGEWLEAPGQPTILIYGHFDVQPAEPLNAWKFPPFAAQIQNGFIHGRGASDDKGQLLTHVFSMASCLKTTRRLPVNVKCLFEGEEEIGSLHLAPFIERNRHALRADAALMSDTRMLGPDQPALTYSLRGQLAMELAVAGPRHDLHSGNFGGAVHDPIQALCEMAARFHDANGRIAIPGFYDRVRALGPAEREYLARTGPSNEAILQEAATEVDWGEPNFSIYERVAARPSLAITGIRGGHGGEGPKGVIPCSAVAKISFRLVPDQRPEEIEQLVRDFIDRIAPRTVRVKLTTQISSCPALLARTHPAMTAAAKAYHSVFGKRPVWVRSGGSIPVVSHFQRLLGISTVLMGFASPGDSLYGPNERFSLKNFQRGILTSIAFLNEFGKSKTPRYDY